MSDNIGNSLSNSQKSFLELLYQIGKEAISCLSQVVWLWSTYHASDFSQRGINTRKYLDELLSLDYSQSLQRINYRNTNVLIKSRDDVINEITSFVCNLSYDDSFNFLVTLTEKWVKTFDDPSLHSLLSQEFTEKDFSHLLLKQIYYELADIEAIDLISNIHRKESD